MNRYLLAGSAAIALVLGAGAANAQAKFDVKVGGDAFFEAGYVDQDLDSGLRSTEFRNRFRVNIIPSAKADNGLEYGGRIRLRANSSGGTVDSDHAYVFVQGGFGQVRMGVTGTVNDDTYVSRPIDSMFLGQSTPWDVYISGNNNSAGLALPFHSYSLVPENNSTKIYYVSPRFSGFQIGATYTPRSDDKNNSIDRRKNVANYQDMYEVAANYNGTFSGVKLSASAGFFGGEARTTVGGANREDLRAWQVGAQIGYAGFAIGGGYTNQGDSGYTSGSTGQDAYSWNAGLQYTTGPIVVGAGYTYGQDSSTGASAGDQDMDVWSVSAAYTVAPGLTVGAEYDYFDVNRTGSTQDDKGSIAMVRSVLAF